MTLRTVSIAGALACATPAFAITVNLSGFQYDPPTSVDLSDTTHGIAYSGAAGQFVGTMAGTGAAGFVAEATPAPTSFTAYCGELTQFFNFNVTYTDYRMTTGATNYGAQKSADLSRLFTAYGGLVVDKATSAAMQAAIWEVIYQDGTVYDLKNGNFRLSSSDAATQTALDRVNGFLTNLSSYAATYRIDVLKSDTYQDFVVGTVPEPGTWMLLGGGLVLVGLGVSRRRGARR